MGYCCTKDIDDVNDNGKGNKKRKCCLFPICQKRKKQKSAKRDEKSLPGSNAVPTHDITAYQRPPPANENLYPETSTAFFTFSQQDNPPTQFQRELAVKHGVESPLHDIILNDEEQYKTNDNTCTSVMYPEQATKL